jgi:hypothetical protein
MRLTKREDFGLLLNGLGLTGFAAEIGTHRGEYAFRFLHKWHGQRLYCIDHWQPNYHPDDPAAQGDREDDYKVTRNRLAYLGDRAWVLRMDSLVAAKQFADEWFDFVYIDACHSSEAIKADIEAWWPKVKKGGILAGHDYQCPSEPNNGWGQYIKPIVDKFIKDKNLKLQIIFEPDQSWFTMKPL